MLNASSANSSSEAATVTDLAKTILPLRGHPRATDAYRDSSSIELRFELLFLSATLSRYYSSRPVFPARRRRRTLGNLLPLPRSDKQHKGPSGNVPCGAASCSTLQVAS
jgi:hypothetical protein